MAERPDDRPAAAVPAEGEACPMPSVGGGDDAAMIARMLGARRIAIVGLSDDPSRPSHAIGEYLLSQGYEVVPVNPTHERVLGRTSYKTLADVPGPIDVVNVFRRPEYCADVARQAIAAGAKGLWLQSGIRNADAKRLAEAAGIDYVENRCIMVEHMTRPQ